MKNSLIHGTGVVALAACLALQPIQASAEIVSTQDAASSQKIQVDRDKIRTFLDRATVKDKLQAMGVQATVAKDRVDALSDSEVELLAQRIDALPAGGYLSNTDIIIILLVVILVAVII
ncbi:PA2779 family protein [Neisseriaceae bacterium JH1-16]|nr:PA2779 family protein [Neisseriaceae bacterium JH1-16]